MCTKQRTLEELKQIITDEVLPIIFHVLDYGAGKHTDLEQGTIDRKLCRNRSIIHLGKAGEGDWKYHISHSLARNCMIMIEQLDTEKRHEELAVKGGEHE